jgi:hypothetical protein
MSAFGGKADIGRAFRGLKIDRDFKFRWPLDWQVRGLGDCGRVPLIPRHRQATVQLLAESIQRSSDQISHLAACLGS